MSDDADEEWESMRIPQCERDRASLRTRMAIRWTARQRKTRDWVSVPDIIAHWTKGYRRKEKQKAEEAAYDQLYTAIYRKGYAGFSSYDNKYRTKVAVVTLNSIFRLTPKRMLGISEIIPENIREFLGCVYIYRARLNFWLTNKGARPMESGDELRRRLRKNARARERRREKAKMVEQ